MVLIDICLDMITPEGEVKSIVESGKFSGHCRADGGILPREELIPCCVLDQCISCLNIKGSGATFGTSINLACWMGQESSTR